MDISLMESQKRKYKDLVSLYAFIFIISFLGFIITLFVLCYFVSEAEFVSGSSAICKATNIQWVYKNKFITNGTIYDEYQSTEITGSVYQNDTCILGFYNFTNVFEQMYTVDPIGSTNITKDCFIYKNRVNLYNKFYDKYKFTKKRVIKFSIVAGIFALIMIASAIVMCILK